MMTIEERRMHGRQAPCLTPHVGAIAWLLKAECSRSQFPAGPAQVIPWPRRIELRRARPCRCGAVIAVVICVEPADGVLLVAISRPRLQRNVLVPLAGGRSDGVGALY